MLSSDIFVQFAEISAAIWVVVEALRKIPGLKNLTSNIPGETVALGVSIVAVLALIATGLLPPDFTTIIKVFGAGLTSQIAHEKISAANKK
jgi:hypothetical protein